MASESVKKTGTSAGDQIALLPSRRLSHGSTLSPVIPVRCTWLVGVTIAFCIVLAWFPKTWSMWNLPIQAIDAPSHYYFVRKLLKNGLSVVFSLNPNDTFYPPLFHLLVYGLIKIAGFFGVTVNIFTGLNVIWLLTSGLVFPVGMLLWCSYFIADLPDIPRAALGFFVPILSVTSAAHPYWLLNGGPLLAYGLATSLLPFFMYAGLRLIDELAMKNVARTRKVLRWLLINVVLGLLLLSAHPRIAFTYLVLMVFFVIVRLPKRFVIYMLAIVCLMVPLFAWYVMHRDHGKNYLRPSTWFHTFQPTRSLKGSIAVVLTDFLPGLAGWLMAICLCASLIICILLSGRRLKDGVALVSTFALTATIYICSASIQGTLANIVTAVWYRGETRPLTMLPLATIPLLFFAARCLVIHLVAKDAALKDLMSRVWPINWKIKVKDRHAMGSQHLSALVVVEIVLLLLALIGNVGNPVRRSLSSQAESNTTLNMSDPTEQLTPTKLAALTKVRDSVERDAVIVSDPMNGSMYGMTLYGLNMLYPVYNPMDIKNGKIFGQVERAFDSRDPRHLLTVVCPVKTSYAKFRDPATPLSAPYFLAMGPQSPSLGMFTYKDQYYPFHDAELIRLYEQYGAIRLVYGFHELGHKDSDWGMYRFNCRLLKQ